MSFAPDRPFNDLPLLPPQMELESRPVLKACITARAALAELKALAVLLPNQAMLINSIPLLEAQASSEIENIVTTADRLFRFANDIEKKTDPATKEALRYRTALYEGFRSLGERPICTTLAVQICSTIKGVDMNIRMGSGTTLVNDTTGKVIYTPPEGEDRLRSKLANWEDFIHGHATLDPLIRMAVMHYQFEAIHPFTDGNGRTGRVLNLLYLVEQGLLDLPILYLSGYIIRHKADYYALLQKVSVDGDWHSWLLYMLHAVAETAVWTTAKIKAIRSLLDSTLEKVRRDAAAIYSRELVELIFMQPYCRIANLVEAGIAQRQAASTYLHKLEEIGVLTHEKVGRERLFIHPALLRLLFAQ